MKAESFRVGSGSGTKRGLKFSKEVLDKLDLYYDVPIQIVIEEGSRTGATDARDATHYSTKQGLKKDISGTSGSKAMPEGMEYWLISTVDDKGNKALGGGMMKRQSPQQQGITNYFDVKSV